MLCILIEIEPAKSKIVTKMSVLSSKDDNLKGRWTKTIDPLTTSKMLRCSNSSTLPQHQRCCSAAFHLPFSRTITSHAPALSFAIKCQSFGIVIALNMASIHERKSINSFNYVKKVCFWVYEKTNTFLTNVIKWIKNRKSAESELRFAFERWSDL